MTSLRDLNPDARYLRGRLRNIGMLYALAAIAATALGFALEAVHGGLTMYDGSIEVSLELAAMLDAADPAAVDLAPVECFNVYVRGHWRVEHSRQALSERTEAMLVERLSPGRLESEMRKALVVGTSEERRRVMRVLEAHPGEATRRLLRIATRDLDPELAERAKRLLGPSR